MDCQRFETEIQTKLDARTELILSDSADAHRLVCEVCDNSWQMYRSLQDGFHFGPTGEVTGAFNFADRYFEAEREFETTGKSAFSDDIFVVENTTEEGFARSESIQVAPITIPATEKRASIWSWKNLGYSLSSVAALALVSLMVSQLLPADFFSNQNGSGTAVVSGSGGTKIGGLGGIGLDKPVVKKINLNEFGDQITQSFEEIDKHWQSYGQARVTMESMPGVRSGTFPITGTFDILRQNLAKNGN